jgi:hypothetical protein
LPRTSMYNSAAIHRQAVRWGTHPVNVAGQLLQSQILIALQQGSVLVVSTDVEQQRERIVLATDLSVTWLNAVSLSSSAASRYKTFQACSASRVFVHRFLGRATFLLPTVMYSYSHTNLTLCVSFILNGCSVHLHL